MMTFPDFYASTATLSTKNIFNRPLDQQMDQLTNLPIDALSLNSIINSYHIVGCSAK